MPRSDYVFDRGTGINIGSQGQNDVAFVSGDPVIDTGQGEFIFEAGVGLGGDVIESLEDFDVGDYCGDTSLFDTQTNVVKVGDRAGRIDVGNTPHLVANTDDVLSTGETYRCWVRTDNSNTNVGAAFFAQGCTLGDGTYVINAEVGDNTFEVNYFPGNDNIVIGSVPLQANEWYELEFGKSGDTITATVTSEDTAELVQGTDTRLDSGGYGFAAFQGQSGFAYYDDYRIV